MENQCYHCKQILECIQLGKRFICKDHAGLKQYQVKEKKSYALKRAPLKRSSKPIKINTAGVNKISKREARNIRNKHRAYDIMAETREHVCSGCSTGSNLTHSHLVPVAQNKKLEAVVSNIVYQCGPCHHIFEHDTEGRKLLLDYEDNMRKISILDPSYYALIKGKGG
jgi:hypothetical protein